MIQGKAKDWYGKPVLNDTDVDGLETAAAWKEFGEGTPRKQAEQEAYDEYAKTQHQKAAAHHLRGMRAAQASGDLDESRLHGEAYHHHMLSLGHDPTDQVPDEIKALVEDEGKARHYKFKSHPADGLLGSAPAP
jgi:hypothetical protein